METPENSVSRPLFALPRPRNRDKTKTGPSAETLLRIEHIEWVGEQIRRTTRYSDHWLDPRWDDLPHRWTFRIWLARRQRQSGKLP